MQSIIGYLQDYSVVFTSVLQPSINGVMNTFLFVRIISFTAYPTLYSNYKICFSWNRSNVSDLNATSTAAQMIRII